VGGARGDRLPAIHETWKTIMTKAFPIVAIAAVALVIAALPASARTRQGQGQRQAARSTAAPAFRTASQPPYPHIIHGGRDMGTDPDVNIRAYMIRDTGMAFGGNR
jgi:hypothetical protein